MDNVWTECGFIMLGGELQAKEKKVFPLHRTSSLENAF
jgi:hypothetical protein